MFLSVIVGGNEKNYFKTNMKKLLPAKKPKKLLKVVKDDFEFPIFKTKTKGVSRSFNLSDPKERKKYFELKAGEEIKKLRKYLKSNTFIAYFLGKKNSGKGTYSKMFAEVIGENYVLHISIGDVVRNVEREIKNKKKKEELLKFLKQNYRGYVSLEETFKALSQRNTKSLLPTEFILALVKREIDKHPKKTIFIDGFPRDLDQISYSLFFRDLIGHRYDPDVFILIDVPDAVIDERIKWRKICPLCQTSRNLKLFPTSKIECDKKKKKFYLICDSKDCRGEKMVEKEGDYLGIKPIKKRIKLDEKLMRRAFSLYGIPKVFLRNSIPVKLVGRFVDKYEITPEYCYKWNAKKKKVEIIEKPWTISNNKGVSSYSLLAPPVTLSMIKQLTKIFNL